MKISGMRPIKFFENTIECFFVHANTIVFDLYTKIAGRVLRVDFNQEIFF